MGPGKWPNGAVVKDSGKISKTEGLDPFPNYKTLQRLAWWKVGEAQNPQPTPTTQGRQV